jgi:hypothetical protein
MASSFRLVPEGRREVVEALGFGLLALGFALETASKAHAPVHGGFRSFDPGFSPIGGTLRRSIHSVAFVAGEEIGRHLDAEATETELPTYDETPEAVVYVGTNSGYGLFVHEGTSRMAARPFFDEALAEIGPRAGGYVAEGARNHLGQA